MDKEKTFGSFLKNQREELIFSRYKVEQLTGVTEAVLSLVERDLNVNKNFWNIYKLLKLYKIKLKDIKKFIPNKEKDKNVFCNGDCEDDHEFRT